MLRLLSRNGVGVKEAMAYCRDVRQKRPCAADADVLANLAGISVEWLEHRMPKPQVRDQWQEIQLFGHSWREPWLLRGIHQQVCPVCIRDHGIARLEWDLLAYPVCHLHEIALQDACQACGRAIRPNRPALEVCDCGAYITALTGNASTVAPSVLTWTAWLSQRLLSDDALSPPSHLASISTQLCGTSPDGAVRLIYAFAGGTKAFRQAQPRSGTAWLRSEKIAHLLAQGMGALQAAGNGMLSGLKASTSFALAEQSVSGITAWDRAVAAREIRRLNLGRRWSNAVPRCPLQQELFGDSL